MVPDVFISYSSEGVEVVDISGLQNGMEDRAVSFFYTR